MTYFYMIVSKEIQHANCGQRHEGVGVKRSPADQTPLGVNQKSAFLLLTLSDTDQAYFNRACLPCHMICACMMLMSTLVQDVLEHISV